MGDGMPVGGSDADPMQRLVVQHRRGPLRVLGAPGTGKTTCLVWASVAQAERFGAGAVLGLAMTRSAARAWQAQSARMLGGLAPQITTFHSLARSIVIANAPGPDAPRLINAPEQESRIRELLAGSMDAPDTWPVEWQPAVRTSSFVRDLRRAMARIRALGLDPGEVDRWAEEAGDPRWAAVARFTEEYLDVLDWENALDYQEVLIRAAVILESDAVLPPEQRWSALLVDEAQELEPMQLRIIEALESRAELSIVAGDPNQGILGFRGADPSLMIPIDDPDSSRIVLRNNHRSPVGIRDASSAMMAATWPSGLDRDERSWLAAPSVTEPADAGPLGPGVIAQHFSTEINQAAHLVAALRRAHDEGFAWSDMAVLVRSPATELPVVARALADAAIPVQQRSGGLPLPQQPAVALLLQVIRIAAGPRLSDLTPAEATDLLVSPLVGVGMERVRSLEAWLRRTSGEHLDEQATSLVSAVLDPEVTGTVPGRLRPVARAATDLGVLLTGVRRQIQEQRSPAEVLWWAWAGGATRPGPSSWPERLRSRALAGGPDSLSANQDLDAVMALFRLAERAPERWGAELGIEAFLAELSSQEISAEPDIARASARDAVTLTSVYGARGSQWRFVAVLGLVEGQWPAPRGAAGLIDPGQLVSSGIVESLAGSRVAEDRRLLHFAMGRALDQVWLAGCGDDEPSRFLAEAGLTVRAVSEKPERPSSSWDLVVELRRGCLDPDEGVRSAAVAQLSRLSGARDANGRPLLSAADPGRWPDARDWSRAPVPLRHPGAPVTVTPSALETLSHCQLRWFWERQVRARVPDSREAAFGTILHAAVAELLESGELTDPLSREVVLDRLWQAARHDAEWEAAKERGLAVESLERAAVWADARPGELRSETGIDCSVRVEVPGAEDAQVRIRGSIDVLEVSAEGEAIVWDFKTRRRKATGREVSEHRQLAGYQLAVAESGVEAAGDPRELTAAGAGLVHLCVPAGVKQPDHPAVLTQEPLTPESAAEISAVLGAAVDSLGSASFAATAGTWCRTCEFVDSCPRARGGGR